MPDLDLFVEVTRDGLGLPPLSINSYPYKVAPQFLGAAVQYNRTQIGSPWMHGKHTTQRQLEMVSEQIGVEVRASSPGELQANMAQLVQAFQQDDFDLHVLHAGIPYHYRCEAADYQVAWTGPRLIAQQGQIVFTVPRQPVPLTGGV